MAKWYERAGKAIYRGADRVAGGYLPGGHRPIHETLWDAVPDGYKDIAGDPLGRDFASDEAERARDHATDMQESANDFSAEQAGISRDFADQQRQAAEGFSSAEAVAARQHQEYMARRAPGLAMEGFREAGLNPMLASQLGGAVPPAGPAAHSSAPSVPQAHGVGGSSPSASSPISAVRDVLGLMQIKAEIGKINSEARRNVAMANKDEELLPWTIEEMKSRMYHLDSQVQLNYAMRRSWEADTGMTLKQLEEFMKGDAGRSAEEAFEKNAGPIYRWYQKWITPLLGPGSKFIPSTHKRR